MRAVLCHGKSGDNHRDPRRPIPETRGQGRPADDAEPAARIRSRAALALRALACHAVVATRPGAPAIAQGLRDTSRRRRAHHHAEARSRSSTRAPRSSAPRDLHDRRRRGEAHRRRVAAARPRRRARRAASASCGASRRAGPRRSRRSTSRSTWSPTRSRPRSRPAARSWSSPRPRRRSPRCACVELARRAGRADRGHLPGRADDERARGTARRRRALRRAVVHRQPRASAGRSRRRPGASASLLELGGNAAVIVARATRTSIAAVARALVGGFAYSGQVCISVQRVYVAPRRCSTRFIERFVAGVRVARRRRPARRGHAGLGPRPPERGRAHRRVDRRGEGRRRARARRRDALPGGGARAVARSSRPCSRHGRATASRSSPRRRSGRSSCVEPYDDVDDAFDGGQRRTLRPAGRRVHERPRSRAARVRAARRRRRAGQRGADVARGHMPYGGMKESGLGREGVRYAIEEMTERRTLVLPPPPA